MQTDTDQVTDALARLRGETDQGCWTPSDWEEHATDTKIARDYALAATDERPLTREWLIAVLGEGREVADMGMSACRVWGHGLNCIKAYPHDGIGIAYGGMSGAFGRLETPADAIAFFQLTRWPVSRTKIVEAWRKMG